MPFINYQNIDFKINGDVFYAAQVSISAQSSVSPVMTNDGRLLNYAPENAVVGDLSCDFYLTGAIPSYLEITGSSESFVAASFAGVEISTIYHKSLSFTVEPFKPILVSADFDWYGSLSPQNFASQSIAQRNSKLTPTYVANGYKSYLDTANLGGVGNILTFTYNSTSDRIPYFKVGQKTPFRVCKLNKKASLKLSSNDLGELIDIQGRNVTTSVSVGDLYGTNLNTFYISGVLMNQSYSVNQGQYLLSSAEIMQEVATVKTIV